MRRRLAVSSALLALMLMAGCASVPRSGGVNQGLPEAPDRSVELDLSVDGPRQDATQSEILDDFLQAAASPRNNFQVASEFLTEEFAAEWRPSSGATVYREDDRGEEAISETLIRVEVVPQATLAGNGTFEVSRSSATVPYDFVFEQVDGQWRIAGGPPGLLIDENLFDAVFRSYTLWFYDPTYRYLVPDVRWFAGRETAQTSVVRALLGGPAEWLDPGVESAFSDDVELPAAAVPVSAGTATVDLEGTVPDDTLTRQRMQLQLEASLSGVRSVTGDIDLRISGIEIDEPPLDPAPERNPRVDQRAVVFDGTTFGYLSRSGTSIAPIDGLSEQIALLQPTGAAVGVGARSAAVLSAEGVSVVRDGEAPIVLDERVGLIPPSIDGYGIVWSIPVDRPNELVWFAPDGATGTLQAPWVGQRIAAFEMSRDSTRLVALLADGPRTNFVVTSVLRESDGSPRELAATVLELASIVGVPRDVTWVDSQRVASISDLPSGGTWVTTQQIGGIPDESDGPDGGVQIDAFNSRRDQRVRTSSGELALRAGFGWQIDASGIRFLASQQPD